MTFLQNIDISDSEGTHKVSNVEVISEDRQTMRVLADIQGNVQYLEKLMSEDQGKTVTLVNRNSSL